MMQAGLLGTFLVEGSDLLDACFQPGLHHWVRPEWALDAKGAFLPREKSMRDQNGQ